jgi:hypothetical protein
MDMKTSKKKYTMRRMQNERKSIVQILQEWLVMKLLTPKVRKHAVYSEFAFRKPKLHTEVAEQELRYIALVYDTEVVEMIRVGDLTAKMILSKDTNFILYDPKITEVKRGMKFLDGEFRMEQTSAEENSTD